MQSGFNVDICDNINGPFRRYSDSHLVNTCVSALLHLHGDKDLGRLLSFPWARLMCLDDLGSDLFSVNKAWGSPRMSRPSLGSWCLQTSGCLAGASDCPLHGVSIPLRWACSRCSGSDLQFIPYKNRRHLAKVRGHFVPSCCATQADQFRFAGGCLVSPQILRR